MNKYAPQDVDWNQIDRFLANGSKKLDTAKKILDLDEEACLQQAYEAMMKASMAFMFSHGFRARSIPGHHIAIVEFVEQRLDGKYADLLALFDHLRRKRNAVLYDDKGFISRQDAEEALKAASQLITVIRGDIGKRKPASRKE